jgi:hypothetical protein
MLTVGLYTWPFSTMTAASWPGWRCRSCFFRSRFAKRRVALALLQPRVLVEILNCHVLVQERFAWSARAHRFAATDLAMPEVVDEQDGDGDLYFKCLLRLPGGHEVIVAESSSRHKVELARQKDASRAWQKVN